MRRIITAIVGAAMVVPLAACGGDTPIEATVAPPPHKPTQAELIERVRPAVPKVFVETEFSRATGSAAVIDASQGLVITSAHVVAGAKVLELKMPGKGRIPATVVGTDDCLDLALLKLDRVPEGLQALSFADSSTLEVGQKLYTLGHEADARRWGQARARGSSGSLDDVHITNADLGPDIPAVGTSLGLTNAPTNPGASGSPVLDENGQVVGIVMAQGGGEAQGYFVESNVVRDVLPKLKAGKIGTGLETIPVRSLDMGALVHATYADDGLTRADARAIGHEIERMGGLLVVGTAPGSPADRKGLEFGMVIVTLNGVDVNTQTKRCRVQSSSHVVKAEGYSLTASFNAFTKRMTVK